VPQCPECGSQKTWKDGLRKTVFGDVQRYLCRDCGFRFSLNVFSHFLKKGDVAFKGGSELPDSGFDSSDVQPVNFLSRKKPQDDSAFVFGEDVGSHDSKPQFSTVGKSINSFVLNSGEHQVCANKGAKNLNPTTEIKTVAGEEEQTTKGKILQFVLHCKNEGLTEETVRIWYNRLKKISENAELNEPESVKAYIAKATFAQGTKYNIVVIYNAYLQFIGKTWKRPKYHVEEKLPEFIPTEQEIDALISGCGKKTAAILQTIKETGMRIGEVLRLKWTWLDSERRILTLNAPEKQGRPRACKISSKLVDMLQAMPKKNELVFAGVNTKSSQNCFKHSRRRLAKKLGTPRLAKIHFHLIRHWFGTMQYHKKPDLIHVQKLLGHRNILATQIYVNLDQALFGEANDEYHVKVAETIEEATKLLAVGYEYVSTMDNKQIYRKRK
jgi:integrase